MPTLSDPTPLPQTPPTPPEDPYRTFTLRRPHERSSLLLAQIPKHPEFAPTRLRFARVSAWDDGDDDGEGSGRGSLYPKRFVGEAFDDDESFCGSGSGSFGEGFWRDGGDDGRVDGGGGGGREGEVEDRRLGMEGERTVSPRFREERVRRSLPKRLNSCFDDGRGGVEESRVEKMERGDGGDEGMYTRQVEIETLRQAAMVPKTIVGKGGCSFGKEEEIIMHDISDDESDEWAVTMIMADASVRTVGRGVPASMATLQSTANSLRSFRSSGASFRSESLLFDENYEEDGGVDERDEGDEADEADEVDYGFGQERYREEEEEHVVTYEEAQEEEEAEGNQVTDFDIEQREKEDHEKQEPTCLSEDDLRDHVINVSRLMGVKGVELDAVQGSSSSSSALSTSGGPSQSPDDLSKQKERDVPVCSMNENRQGERGAGMKSKIKATLSAAISHRVWIRDARQLFRSGKNRSFKDRHRRRRGRIELTYK